jgi:hypothetical protein
MWVSKQVPRTRTKLFWVIMHRVAVISYRRFGTTYRSHPQGSRNLLRYNPEERSSQLLRGGSMKSRRVQRMFI